LYATGWDDLRGPKELNDFENRSPNADDAYENMEDGGANLSTSPLVSHLHLVLQSGHQVVRDGDGTLGVGRH
jgi:hypothetical protein